MQTKKEAIEAAKKRREDAVRAACKMLGSNCAKDDAFDAVATEMFDPSVILEMIWSPYHKTSVMGIEGLRNERRLQFLEAVMSLDASVIKEKSDTVHELSARSLVHSREYRVTVRFSTSSVAGATPLMIQYIRVELVCHLFGALMNDAAPLVAMRDFIHRINPTILEYYVI